MSLKDDIDTLVADAAILNSIVHGSSSSTVSTDGGPVKTVAKAIADAEAAIVIGAESYLAQCQAETAAAAAQAALTDADRIAAQAAATEAAAAWAAALAANPDLNPAVRMNPSTITEDLTIPTGYNAYSAGPLTVGDGVEVTLEDHSNWSVL
jgi:hypothetical protein